MMLLKVLICSLVIASTHAIVSEKFKNCLDFFFNKKSPEVRYYSEFSVYEMKNKKCLCEEYKGMYYFATLYDTVRKIPLYSAYKIEQFEKDGWISNVRNWRKGEGLPNYEQALRPDYTGVGKMDLDRGHLATRFHFPTEDGRKATDVLTNIAPQYKQLNRQAWFNLEKKVFVATRDHCHIYGGKSYIITGVVPSENLVFFNDVIDIPIYFWTAVCCDTSNVSNLGNRFKGWSLAYMVKNTPYPHHTIETFTVKDFLRDERISTRYVELFATIPVFGIEKKDFRFVRNCLFDSKKANEIKENIKPPTSSRNKNYVQIMNPGPYIINVPFYSAAYRRRHGRHFLDSLEKNGYPFIL